MRGAKRALGLMAISGLATATAATAQTTTPQPTTVYTAPARAPATSGINRYDLIGSWERTNPAARRYISQYQQILSFGRCATNVARDRSASLLAAVPNSPDEGLEAQRIGDLAKGCLPSGFRAPVIFLRAGVAEALYKRLPADVALRRAGTSAADVTAFETAEQQRSGNRLVDDADFTRTANCYAINAPAQVRATLLATPGSTAERTALNTMASAAPQCGGGSIGAGGGTVFLRAYLAESAYRWATSSTRS